MQAGLGLQELLTLGCNQLIFLLFSFLTASWNFPLLNSWVISASSEVLSPLGMLPSWSFPIGPSGKESIPIQVDVRDVGSVSRWKDPVEQGTETHSSILAWRIPWTEEPGGLQSMGLQRVRRK